jgi:hypothetical protein
LSDEIVHAKKKSLELFQIHRDLILLEPFFSDAVQELKGRALEKQIEIKLDLLRGPRVYSLDSQLIKRAIGNLIHNAIRVAPEKSEIQVVVARNADALTISVQDQGPGVPQEIQQQLFNEPTERSRDHPDSANRGLGLVIVKRIAEAHGGKAWLESSSSAGSQFCFQIRAK